MSIESFGQPAKQLLLATQSRVKEPTQEDQKNVESWLSRLANGVGDLDKLNTELTPRTYIAANYPTIADVALYTSLHPVLSSLDPKARYTHPAIVRYFDHIQSSDIVRGAESSDAFPVIDLELDKAPSLERKAPEPKKKEKTVVEQVQQAAEGVKETVKAAVAAVVPDAVKEQQQPKKQKKEKKEAPPPKQEEGAGEPKPSMIDLRVGHIVDVKKHPDADGLYVEQIDLGEETGPRTVVSGLVNYIPIEQMRDKYLVAVCNLKPANMRGVKSFAMVLCATSKDGKEAGIELIQPPEGSKPGDRVYFEGSEYENVQPVSQLNPKKKIFETIQPGFITLDSREAAWVDPNTKSVHRIRTEKGVCVAPTLVGASLS